MRRFLFGVVIASVTAAMPAWAFGGDREIAKAIMSELQQHKAAGELKGFDIDLKVEDGVVYLTGEVATQGQRNLVAAAAADAVGPDNMVNRLQIKPAAAKPAAPKVAASKPAAPKVAIPKPAAPKVAIPKPAAPMVVTPKPAAAEVAVPKPVQEPTLVRTASTTNPVANSAEVSDGTVTDVVIGKLQASKATGMLRGFELDVSTVNGDVWLRGKVSNQAQKDHVIDLARRTRGVARVIDDVVVAGAQSSIRPASTAALEDAGPAPMPIPQGSSMPVAGGGMAPQAFAPSGMASVNTGGSYASGMPVPMNGGGMSYGAGAPRYDQPNMPNYAWPSYAAHPNYAAVTYPKQYSPSAWPYIGPFYPYPQVPLGWRKVALEWDDGLWYLDFTSK